ncbi:MAG: D-alanyl-D-alanine carboxypeptidase, partial [Pyrinomonadaceae bacterium]
DTYWSRALWRRIRPEPATSPEPTAPPLTPLTPLTPPAPRAAPGMLQSQTRQSQTGQPQATDLSKLKMTTAEAGVRAIRAFLTEVGIQDDEISVVDGSGLSRTNLVSADDTIRLLIFMNKHTEATFFRDALPVGGVDGTLKNRFKIGAATNNVRAKTGSLSNVSALSGYVTTAAGEHLVFSLMINHSIEDGNSERSHLDSIVDLLSAFNGKL